MRRFVPYLSRSIPWVLLALSLCPLVVWACLGFFTRYMADDYSTSSELLRQGFWQAQAYWYQAWSGRYSYNFLVALAELPGVRVVAWLPLVSLSVWFLSLFWALKQIFKALDIPLENKWLAILTSVILFGAARSLGDYSQVLFWQTGILTYQISNILLAACLALFLRRFLLPDAQPGSAGWEYLGGFTLAFLIGGFSETGIVIQIALLTLALLYFSFQYKATNRVAILVTLLAAWLGSCCALIVIAKAPGNLQRNAGLAGLSLQSLGVAFMAAIQDALLFMIEWLRDNSVLAGMLFLAGLFIGLVAIHSVDKDKKNTHLRVGLALLLVAYASLAAGFFPSYVAWGIRPPDRAIFVPVFIFVWAFVLLGFFAGSHLSSYFSSGTRWYAFQSLLFALLVLSMYWMQVRTAIASAQLIPTLRIYAQLWDERDAVLRQAGVQRKGDVVIPSLRRDPALHDLPPASIWMLGELEENPSFWINQAAASYYGLKSISAIE